MNREETLDTAKDIIHNARNEDYGDPIVDFRGIAELWTTYKGVKFEPHDVAAMMILLKIGRIRFSPLKDDHWVDIAGYSACGSEVKDYLVKHLVDPLDEEEQS